MARWDRGDTRTIPEWFFEAAETPHVDRTVEVDECDVAYQLWGVHDTAKPGVLFVHGMNAHAHWWDFIAPQLLDGYRCAAMNLTGMGDSDYRYEYDGATYAEEIKAVCDHAGFGNDVAVVAHSFGGNMAVKAAGLFPGRFGALVLVDSGIRDPEEPVPDRPPMGGRAKVYPDRESAMARFRLQPPQPCENDYILQYIARNSLMPVEGGGYAWKFDEDLPGTLKNVERHADDYQALELPVGLIYGAESDYFSSRTLDYTRSLIPGDVPAVGIENARHHVFLDQPLAFVDALKGMLDTLRI